MSGKVSLQRIGQVIKASAGTDEKYIEIINAGLLRVYRKKNSEALVKLHYEKEDVAFEAEETEGLGEEKGGGRITFGDYEITVKEDLTLHIKRKGEPYFAEYDSDATINAMKQDFTLAELEGHKQEKNLVNFNTQINIAFFGKEDKVYGLGDKTAQLNRRGYEYISWNTDDPTAHNETYKSLYKSINYFMVNHGNEYYGIFYPSSYKCIFNLGKYSDKFLYIGSGKGEYDYFILLGKNPADITKTYASMVGKTLFVPRKMLGYHQSRWPYYACDVKEIREKFRQYGMPIDYIHLDIDYMERYKVYTVEKEEFPDLGQTAESLAEDGIAFITIIDPGVKVEDGYEVYDYLKEHNGFATLEGEQYVNQVWPGDSKYPNYFSEEVSRYVTEITKKFMEENKVSGIWCDMNEPASFQGPLPDEVVFEAGDGVHYHDEIHNLYGDYMTRAVARAFEEENKRPAVITRAAFATTAAFSTTWNGDNQSLWSHLEASLPQVVTMNLCNFAVNGVDIGGFGGDTTKELLIRWVEANMFSLFLRNHSALGTRRQEPYAFDRETAEIYRDVLKLRYEFIPYLYDLLEQAHRTGIPAQRPLFFDYPLDERAKQVNDEILIGGSILFAPVVRQGEVMRAVYLPEGKWVHYFTKEEYEGNKTYLVDMPLDSMGIFVKAGAIIPMYKGLLHIENKKLDTLYLYVEKGGDGEYVHYEDDGESLDYRKGVYNRYKITNRAGKLKFETLEGNYASTYKEIVALFRDREYRMPFGREIEWELEPV